MIQRTRKLELEERLIQYAIELFDLVEIAPAASAGRPVGRRFLQPDALPAIRYGDAQNASSRVGGNP